MFDMGELFLVCGWIVTFRKSVNAAAMESTALSESKLFFRDMSTPEQKRFKQER
jgi:hypothetical protein